MKQIKFLIVILLAFSGCAKIVAPVGGPKDTTPPIVIKESPDNGSINFTGNTLKITFNEFVNLNNPIENIIFSPPLDQASDISLKGKSVILKWKDTLKVNTTYSIVFADAIKDYNEGNILNLYQYSFSTGSQIDTFKLSGILKNGETTQPEKGVFVFLYTQTEDSVPCTIRPTYITKTKPDGTFTFRNIKMENYKIFALKDINSNLLFDLPNEGVAFLNERVYPDTISRIQLSFFTAMDTIQTLQSIQNHQKGLYLLPLKLPCKSENSVINTLLYPPAIEHYTTINETFDSLTYYFFEDITDSVVMKVEIPEWNKCDTLTFMPYKVPYRPGRNKTETKLGIQYSNKGEFYESLTLNFSFPIKPNFNIETIIIKNGKEKNDTVVERFQINGKLLTSFVMPYHFEPKESYEIIFKDSLFYGWDGTTNDSLNIKFTTKTERDYGSLTMNYVVSDGELNYVITLLDQNNKKIKVNTISTTSSIKYEHLVPGNYKIKVIKDQNGNGKWDSGNYDKKLQPEQILFFDKTLSVRGFWELEEKFEIK
jgi:hypothetical protein